MRPHPLCTARRSRSAASARRNPHDIPFPIRFAPGAHPTTAIGWAPPIVDGPAPRPKPSVRLLLSAIGVRAECEPASTCAGVTLERSKPIELLVMGGIAGLALFRV